MTSEVRFKELAVEYITNNKQEFLDVGTFKNYLESINFPFDHEDLKTRSDGTTLHWQYCCDNIVCHNSMSAPCVVNIKYTEPPPTDPKERAIWKQPRSRYFFTHEDNPSLETLQTIPGFEILNENLSLPTHLFDL